MHDRRADAGTMHRVKHISWAAHPHRRTCCSLGGGSRAFRPRMAETAESLGDFHAVAGPGARWIWRAEMAVGRGDGLKCLVDRHVWRETRRFLRLEILILPRKTLIFRRNFEIGFEDVAGDRAQ